MNLPDNIIPLHRGTYLPPLPRHVPPRTGEQLQRLTGDKDAVFVRGEPRDVREFDPVDLNKWLDRGRDSRLQRTITAASITVAVLCIIYFSFQLGRGAF